MTRSTFSGFTIAQLAMTASQRALDVTGQNIANINTKGYTRQQVDLVSINLRGAEPTSSNPGSKIGYGVEVSGISQIRDPFLDVQYRNQIAKVGTADARQAVLDKLGDIFDETDRDALKKALSDLSSSLDQLSSNANNSEFDSIVRSRCQVLLNYVHQKSADLETTREETIYGLENTDIKTVNSLLSDLGEINDTIWKSQMLGNPSLELMDQRNSKLDDLASYLPISVSYKEVTIGTSAKYSYPVVTMNGSNGMSYELTAGEHGEHFAEFYMDQPRINDSKSGTIGISVIPAANYLEDENKDSLKTDITDFLKEGTIKGTVDMLNKSGELDNPVSDIRGLGYYEKVFDSFVDTFAKTFNDLNNPINSTNFDLFKTTDGSKKFTASNIKINDDWMNNSIHIISSHNDNAGSTANDNILKMLKSLTDSREFNYEYTTLDNNSTSYIPFYTGSFSQCYSTLENNQGIDSSKNKAILDNHVSVVKQTANNKDAISGVSLDEEGINLMHYQKSFSAAARFMTTLDQALDVLINNTGVVGR